MCTLSQISMHIHTVIRVILPTWNIIYDAFIMNIFNSLKKQQQQKIKMASAQGKKIVQSTQDGLQLLSVPVISFQSAEINTFFDPYF